VTARPGPLCPSRVRPRPPIRRPRIVPRGRLRRRRRRARVSCGGVCSAAGGRQLRLLWPRLWRCLSGRSAGSSSAALFNRDGLPPAALL